MRTVVFGVRNVYRNPARAVLTVLVLGLSVGLFVTMLRGSANTALEAQKLKAQAATLILINEAGNSSGYAGEVTEREIPADMLERISANPNVVEVEPYVKRPFVNNRRREAPTVVVTGVVPGDTLRLEAMGGFVGTPILIAGRNFTPEDSGRPVAIVGEVFARLQGVGLGDEFVLPGKEAQGGRWVYPHDIRDLRAKVIGIFRVGVVYGDNQVFVPIRLAQEYLGIGANRVSQVYATVDSADNVARTAADLRNVLGTGFDVISQDQTALQTAGSLEAASANNRVGAIIAAIVGALVVLFTMVIVTRERTREIGVLKAIGASNPDIAALFSAETVTLALVGAGVGLIIYAFGGPVLGGVFVGTIGPEVDGSAANSLGPTELAWGLGLAIAFGLIGSLYTVWRAIRMRPSEAMRQR